MENENTTPQNHKATSEEMSLQIREALNAIIRKEVDKILKEYGLIP